MHFPRMIPKPAKKADRGKRSPAHRKWVGNHECCACGATARIECAHVRVGTDGGMGQKPSDWWTISLCHDCHNEQHRTGERSFERKYKIDMKALAEEFFARSPHKHKMERPRG